MKLILILTLLLITTCNSQAQDLDCKTIKIKGAYRLDWGYRCENKDAICYIVDGTISCVLKKEDKHGTYTK